MKSVLLRLLIPLLTFSLGVGFDRLVTKPAVEIVPPAVETPAAMMNFPIPAPPFVPLPAPVVTAAPVDTPIPLIPKPVLLLDNPSKIYGTHPGFMLIGPKPKDFPYFDFIEVSLSEYGAANFISIYESTSETLYEYQASFALVTNKRLFFVTSQTDSGFEYRFDGEFVNTDFERIAGTNKIALRGTLTKTKDGRTVAERMFNFKMHYLGC